MNNNKTVSLTGEDTLVIQGRVITNVADGDWASFSFPNNIANVKVGKNGNAIYALNATGKMTEAEIRLIRGTDDDIFLNDLMQAQFRDFASFILLSGQFTKRVGDGQGNVLSDTYQVSGGVFIKQVGAKSNAEGDTEQSVSVYNITFANGDRALF